MSDIEILASEIQVMTTSHAPWQSAVVLVMAITAFLGVVYFVTSIIERNKAKEISEKKDELIKLKDEQQALQIKKVETDSEEKINSVKADADKQIALLNAEAEKSKSEIAKAQVQAAQANEKAESERLARVQLEARLAPRNLSSDQKIRLVSLLKNFSSTEVDLAIFGDTSETKTIGMIMGECLRNAGWNVHIRHVTSGLAVKGVLVGVRPGSHLVISEAAKALISGLRSMGVDSGLWDFNKMQYGTAIEFGNLTENAGIKVFVGSKP